MTARIVAVCLVALLAIVPCALGSTRHKSRHHKAHLPAPAAFDVKMALSGEYAYHYTAPEGLDVEEVLTFSSAPYVSFAKVLLYTRGKPPKGKTHVVEPQQPNTPGLGGTWRIKYLDPSGGDSCHYVGEIEENWADPPVLTASYVSHRYDMAVHAAGSANPFLSPTTNIEFGPCGVRDPWREWVIHNGLANEGAETFISFISVSQAQLRAAANGKPVAFPVSLAPSAGLTSSDCGSLPASHVSCTQSLSWTGTVVIRRARK